MFNALKYIRKLEQVGFARDQAETHLQIITEIVEDSLATKQDIQKLEHKLVELEYRLIIKLGTITTVAMGTCVAIVTLLAKSGLV